MVDTRKTSRGIWGHYSTPLQDLHYGVYPKSFFDTRKILPCIWGQSSTSVQDLHCGVDPMTWLNHGRVSEYTRAGCTLWSLSYTVVSHTGDLTVYLRPVQYTLVGPTLRSLSYTVISHTEDFTTYKRPALPYPLAGNTLWSLSYPILYPIPETRKILQGISRQSSTPLQDLHYQVYPIP